MGWLVGDRVFRMGVGLVVGVWVARYLGPERFGLLSYAGAWVFVFSFLSSLGLDTLVIRELVSGKNRHGIVMGTAFWLKAVGGVAVVLLSCGVAMITDKGEPVTISLIAITALGTLCQATDVLDYHFQALVQSRYITIARGIAFQALSIVKVVMILTKASLIAFALAGLAETILGALLLWIVYRRTSTPADRWTWSTVVARRLLSESWPLMFSALMITLYMKIDQVMLKSLSSAEEIGKYAAAVRISEGWYFVPMAIATSSFPKLVEAKAASEQALESMARRLYAGMLVICYGIIIPLCLLAGPLSDWMYGAKFHGMAGMLALNSWSGLFVGIGVIRSGYLTIQGQTRYYMWTIITGAVLNIGLNFAFMPQYGGMAAAAATLAAQALASYFSSFFFKPLRTHAWLITTVVPPWSAWRAARLSEILKVERLPAPLRRIFAA